MKIRNPNGKINRRGLFAGATAALAATAAPAVAEPKYFVHGLEMTANEHAAYTLGRHAALREVMEQVDWLKAEQEAENAS